MKNSNILKPRRRVSKIVLWILFTVLILGGAAFASWYFLINPETKASNQQLQSFKVMVTEWRYWAEPELQPNTVSREVAQRAWDDYKLGRNGWQKVTLQSVIDNGRAESVSKFYGKDPKDFYLVRKSMSYEYTDQIPRGNTWYFIGDLTGHWDLNGEQQVPGRMNGGVNQAVGITFYELAVTQNASKVEVKNVHAIQNGLDYRTNGIPIYYPVEGKDNYYSYGFATYARYKGGGAYDTAANLKGTSAEITKAYRIVKTVADQADSYDSYYSFSADASHYGLRSDVGDEMKNRASRSAIKNEKIMFSFKALDNSSDIANGRGIYILGETPLSGGNFQVGADEYAWSYANKKVVKEHANILHLSPDILAQRNQDYVDGKPGWGVAPNYYEMKLKYSDYDSLKTAYSQGKFFGWKRYGDLDRGARVFNVGREELSKQISFAGKTYTIYPVLVGAPGVAAPPSTTEVFDNIHVYWALKLNKNQTFDCEYNYNLDQDYRTWLASYLLYTEKGKKWISEYQKNYKERTGILLTSQQVIDRLKTDSSLLTNYRSLFSVYTVKELSTKDNFFYDGNSKIDVASAEVYSDPVSNFHSFPYFKKNGQYPEEKYSNQWKLERDYVGAKATFEDNQVRLVWLYKNTFKPIAFRIYRSTIQNFKPIGGQNGNQIATVEVTNREQTVFEYTDTNPGLEDNATESQWYRVVAVYDSVGHISPWTKSFRAEIERPLPSLPAPTDVDVFGMDKSMEVTWKAGSVAEISFAGSNSEGGQVKAAAIGQGVRVFDVYRTGTDPSKAAKVSFLNRLISPAFAAETGWTKVASKVSDKSGDKYIFIDKRGLVNGKTYWYKVVEVQGNFKSADSNIDNDNPHVWADVNKDGFVRWDDVTRVLVYPVDYRSKVVSRDVTEDVNNDKVVDWYDVYGGEKEVVGKGGLVTKVILRGILQYPGFPEVEGAKTSQPGGSQSKTD